MVIGWGNEFYKSDGTPIKCQFCKFTIIDSVAIADGVQFTIIDSVATADEVQFFCYKCGRRVGRWTYGGFDPAYRIAY
jgi:hypothetical protein